CLSGLIFIPLRRKRADRDERVAARGRGRRKSFRLRGRRIGWGLLPGHVRGWERIAPFPNGASPPAMAAAPAFRALSPWLIEPADARDHAPPAAWRDGSPTYTPNTGTDFRPAAPPLWGGCLPLVPPALAGRRCRSPKILRAQCRFPSPPLVKKAKWRSGEHDHEFAIWLGHRGGGGADHLCGDGGDVRPAGLPGADRRRHRVEPGR